MCLLWTQTADTNFTEEHLLDFYSRNRDGAGFMWAEGGALHYRKALPRSGAEFVAFYNENCRGKAGAGHVRMRTHGNIDMTNCHPYPVFGFDAGEAEMPMLLMHNGVLHTGNSTDTTKSDTWHYIRTYLRPLLDKDPGIAFEPFFADVIGKHIGSNRFVLMNHSGQMVTINESQGVRFNGAWLSNEYAWSAAKYLPRKAYTGYTGGTGGWGAWDAKQGKRINGGSVPAKKQKTTKRGGTTTLTGTTVKQAPLPLTFQAQVNQSNGVSTDSKWLDDVLELRSLLDAFYIDNTTTNRQLEAMIEEMGVTAAYFAVELLGDGVITEKSWDSISTSRKEMRYFAEQPRNTWYDSVKTLGELQ